MKVSCNLRARHLPPPPPPAHAAHRHIPTTRTPHHPIRRFRHISQPTSANLRPQEFIKKRVETTHPKLVGGKLDKAWADEMNSVRALLSYHHHHAMVLYTAALDELGREHGAVLKVVAANHSSHVPHGARPRTRAVAPPTNTTHRDRAPRTTHRR